MRHFRNDKGTGAEMSPANVSGIVTRDLARQLLARFSRVLSNGARSLCES